MSTEIVTYEQESNPAALFHRATDVAGVCGEIVKRTAKYIQGRKYVQVEGWQSIAAAYGYVASSTRVEKVEGGVRAIGELRRVSDGTLLATAEGFVGEDEPTWYGGESRGKTLPRRADYAIRAMAQTRAISRVCRSAFAFVVVLIDGKLATTPAEEMPYDPDDEKLKDVESRAAGKSPAGEDIPPGAGASAPETRTQALKRMCQAAYGDSWDVQEVKILDKAGVKSAEEISDQDWREAKAMLERKIARRAELAGQA